MFSSILLFVVMLFVAKRLVEVMVLIFQSPKFSNAKHARIEVSRPDGSSLTLDVRSGDLESSQQLAEALTT